MVMECLHVTSLLPMGKHSALYGYGVRPNDRLLDASGIVQTVAQCLQMSASLQMTDSLMPMEMLSELYGYGVPPNDHLLDANGNTQRALWWDRLLDAMEMPECLQLTAS